MDPHCAFLIYLKWLKGCLIFIFRGRVAGSRNERHPTSRTLSFNIIPFLYFVFVFYVVNVVVFLLLLM